MTLVLVPLALLAIACVLKFSVVLSLLGRAIGGRALPGTVVAGVAILLAAFVLAPLVGDGGTAALGKSSEAVRGFLETHTTAADRDALVKIQHEKSEGVTEHDLGVMLPAYALAQLKLAFRIGFFLLLPFLVLDLLIAVALLGLGVRTLDARIVSLPLKLLLFVSIDGWNLVMRGLLT